MIWYKNYQRKLRNKEEEVEAVRRCNDKAKTNGEIFEVIECVLNRTSVSPVKKHGFQDSEIHVGIGGEIAISDYEAGRGVLRFEPSRFGNPVAYLSRTPHNMQMLVKHYRNREWSLTDRHLAEEVKKSYEIWWDKLPQEEKKSIITREEQGKRDQFSLPAETGVPDTDSAGKNLLAELAAQKEEVRKLKAANLQLQDMKKPEPVAPEKQEEAPVEPKKDTPEWVVKDVDGTEYDFNTMPMFSVHKVARKKGLLYSKDSKQAELVPKIIEKINEEKRKT
jgi:hypothetical protein